MADDDPITGIRERARALGTIARDEATPASELETVLRTVTVLWHRLEVSVAAGGHRHDDEDVDAARRALGAASESALLALRGDAG